MPTQGHFEQALARCADAGKAHGLEIAVKVLRALADEGPDVPASELYAAALSLERSASKLRRLARKDGVPC